MAMDELDSWVMPVRLAPKRRGAPVTPEMMGWSYKDPATTIIWFDQGGTTGWAVFNIWPEALQDPGYKILSNIHSWSAGEFIGSEDEMIDSMMDLIYAWEESAYVGYEDFILRKFSMGRELLSPVRLGARLEDRMYREKRTAQLQSPQQSSLAFTKVTDDRLKQWGFWNPLKGQEHARDAVRHAITFASRLKESNLKRSAR